MTMGLGLDLSLVDQKRRILLDLVLLAESLRSLVVAVYLSGHTRKSCALVWLHDSSSAYRPEADEAVHH